MRISIRYGEGDRCYYVGLRPSDIARGKAARPALPAHSRGRSLTTGAGVVFSSCYSYHRGSSVRLLRLSGTPAELRRFGEAVLRGAESLQRQLDRLGSRRGLPQRTAK